MPSELLWLPLPELNYLRQGHVRGTIGPSKLAAPEQMLRVDRSRAFELINSWLSQLHSAEYFIAKLPSTICCWSSY